LLWKGCDFLKTSKTPLETSLEPMDNGKLIDYIDGAKDWLDKAKTEYSQANPMGGELILNLAQAEIKYAWELSRSNYVSDSMKPVRKRGRKFNPILPVAASFLVLLGFGWWLTAGLHTFKNGPILARNPNSGFKEKAVDTAPKNTVKVEEISPVADKPTNQLALGNKPEPEKTEPVTSVTNDQPDRNKQLRGNTSSSSQTRIKENPAGQPNLQPVSKLVIDEEALTKEASHSLRNGK
jgi:hypothetical protein